MLKYWFKVRCSTKEYTIVQVGIIHQSVLYSRPSEASIGMFKGGGDGLDVTQ